MRYSFRNLAWEHEVLKPQLQASFDQILKDSSFIHGPANALFEHSFASFSGGTYGIGVSSGTDAISLTLKALNIQPGDEVITTPYTFVATLEAIEHIGATPVLADVDEWGLLDVKKAEAAVTSKTKALLPVHLFGLPCHPQAFEELAKRKALYLVFDAAQAHGTLFDDRPIAFYGDASTFSFMPAKTLGALGDGGMIVTQNAQLAERLKKLRDHGRTSKYEHEIIGYCNRLDHLQAMILLEKLKILPQWIQRKDAIAKIYQHRFNLNLLPLAAPCYYVFPLFVKHRDKLKHELENQGIETGIYYPIPCHLQKAFAHLGYKQGDFPMAERLCSQVLAIPINPSLEINDAVQISEIVSRYL
jgi:dTDP-4-amino-4,6-dideoxygalactose transaminase